MNKDLAEIIEIYATQDEATLLQALAGKSSMNLRSVLTDLLTMYFNDKNSSTLREFVLVTQAGYVPTMEKLGYNGYRQSGIGKVAGEFCEAKPMNVQTDSDSKTKRKLNGSGNFTDFTFKRLRDHIKANPLMIVGGFIDGRLFFVFTFEFKTKPFIKALREKLKKRFPRGKDIKGQYLRSASFNLKDYVDYAKLSIFVSSKELENNQEHITRNLYAKLMEHIEERENE